MARFEGLGENVSESTRENPDAYAEANQVALNAVAGQLRAKTAERFLAEQDESARIEIVKNAIGDDQFAFYDQDVKDGGFPEGLRMDELAKVVRRVHDLFDGQRDVSATDRALEELWGKDAITPDSEMVSGVVSVGIPSEPEKQQRR